MNGNTPKQEAAVVLSDWAAGVVAREVSEVDRQVLLDTLAGLDGSIFDNQNQDRMVAAILILFLEGIELDIIIDEAKGDWRDLLVDAGLENEDWSTVVARKFGTSPQL